MRCLILLAMAAVSQAAVKFPSLISDHMVLQQGAPVRIWGTADPGEEVRVQFQGQSATAKADTAGKWTAWLKPLTAGGPLEMTINNLTLQDVLVGEVWIGSGQSNMEWPMGRVANREEEIPKANYPQIHLFHVKKVVADQPASDVEASWTVCTPGSIPQFSAVEYFFGRELHQSLKVPMGLIESDWGGTPAQAWTSRERLERDPSLKYVLDAWDQMVTNYPPAKEAYDKRLEDWKKLAAAASAENKPAPPRPPAPQGPGHPNSPAGLYNAMIAPLTPYAIRGVIWYQGESNANEAHAWKYRWLFRAMIEDWRAHWGQGDFPFLFVQLPNWQTNGWWPVLRESQTETLALRNTGMAVAIDVGDPKNLHPPNKLPVGQRLSLIARHMVYGQPVDDSGPQFRQASAEGSQMRVWFDLAEGLQARSGGSITGFTVAGEDGKFVPAEARVDGASVVVSSAQVSTPTAVRYAWADAPEANLTNRSGLPAGPFRYPTRPDEH
jgi:sialate O-acetylesterase